MRLPFDHWLTFLLTVGLSDEEIRHLCAMDDLVVPEVAELAHLRYLAACAPKGFRWQDPDNAAGDRYLQDLGIRSLARGKAKAREAVCILRDPLARHAIEILLLGGHDEETVEQFFRERKLPDVDPQAVRYFDWLFWNTRAMGLDEIAAFLARAQLDAYKDALNGGETAMKLADEFVNRLWRNVVVSTLPGGGPGPLLRGAQNTSAGMGAQAT